MLIIYGFLVKFIIKKVLVKVKNFFYRFNIDRYPFERKQADILNPFSFSKNKDLLILIEYFTKFYYLNVLNYFTKKFHYWQTKG
jgi:hypothetical protein